MIRDIRPHERPIVPLGYHAIFYSEDHHWEVGEASGDWIERDDNSAKYWKAL